MDHVGLARYHNSQFPTRADHGDILVHTYSVYSSYNY
jgi:hypothetical protein